MAAMTPVCARPPPPKTIYIRLAIASQVVQCFRITSTFFRAYWQKSATCLSRSAASFSCSACAANLMASSVWYTASFASTFTTASKLATRAFSESQVPEVDGGGATD